MCRLGCRVFSDKIVDLFSGENWALPYETSACFQVKGITYFQMKPWVLFSDKTVGLFIREYSWVILRCKAMDIFRFEAMG